MKSAKKHVLVTGASSGLGLQLALDYHQAGWQVIACGRDGGKLKKSLNNPDIQSCVFDVTDGKAAARALSALPILDLAILNAGSCEYVDDARALDTVLFQRMLDTNVTGTLNSLAPIIERMADGGRLAIVSSLVTQLPLTRAAAYGASKAALDYLARSLRIDLAPHNIKLSLIRPGFVDTPLTRKNTFPMPGRISAAKASQIIRHGLARGCNEISFPWAFATAMGLLSLLPNNLWFRLAVKMRKSA